MSDNPPSSTPDLGPVLLSCRPLPGREYYSKIGEGVLWYYIAPYIGLPLALSILVPILWLVGPEGPLVEHPFWLVACISWEVGGLALAVWWFWLSPQRDRLVLHAEGFRWRIRPWGGCVPFEELRELQFRPDWNTEADQQSEARSKEEKVAEFVVDLFAPRGDVRLEFTDGRTRTLRNLLHRFDAEDTAKFLDGVVKRLMPIAEDGSGRG